MADSFSIHQIAHYLRQMGVEIARLDDGRDITARVETGLTRQLGTSFQA